MFFFELLLYLVGMIFGTYRHHDLSLVSSNGASLWWHTTLCETKKKKNMRSKRKKRKEYRKDRYKKEKNMERGNKIIRVLQCHLLKGIVRYHRLVNLFYICACVFYIYVYVFSCMYCSILS